MNYLLETRWTISRGRDTYGYNICTLYVNGERVARCSGGGYDMHGTVFATWLQATFPDRLRSIRCHTIRQDGGKWLDDRDGMYGATRQLDGTVTLNGGCGFESIRRIAQHVGLTVETIETKSRNRSQWLVTDARGEAT